MALWDIMQSHANVVEMWYSVTEALVSLCGILSSIEILVIQVTSYISA